MSSGLEIILYLGIGGQLNELSVSNNEVLLDTHLLKEYQSLFENRIPDEAPFYLLVPSSESFPCDGRKKHALPQL